MCASLPLFSSVMELLHCRLSDQGNTPSLLPLQAVIELVRRRLSGHGDIGDMLADLKEPAEGGEVRGRGGKEVTEG